MWLYVFLTSAPDGNELSDSSSDGFNFEEVKQLYALNWRLDVPQDQSGSMEKRYISYSGRKSIL